MSSRLAYVLSLFCLCFFPASLLAQCPPSRGTDQDKLCWNLQYILYAAETDYREFRAPHGPAPELSLGSTKVPCELAAWLNNVATYRCSADVSPTEANEWYAKTLATLSQLQYLWHFDIESNGSDHYADAGPAGCEVPPQAPPVDGPYLGQCPLHLQEVRQTDGSTRVSLWLNSYTSPYLDPEPPELLAKSAAKSSNASIAATQPTESSAQQALAEVAGASANPTSAACDEWCQGLKKIFEARATGFQALIADNPGGNDSNAKASSSAEVSLTLPGASNCQVVTMPSTVGPATAGDAPRDPGVTRTRSVSTAALHSQQSAAPDPQYVCYWPEASRLAAEALFRNLCSRLQIAMPSTWSAKQEDSLDELTGAKQTVWVARDSAQHAAVRLYVSGLSVGLHITASQ